MLTVQLGLTNWPGKHLGYTKHMGVIVKTLHLSYMPSPQTACAGGNWKSLLSGKKLPSGESCWVGWSPTSRRREGNWLSGLMWTRSRKKLLKCESHHNSGPRQCSALASASDTLVRTKTKERLKVLPGLGTLLWKGPSIGAGCGGFWRGKSRLMAAERGLEALTLSFYRLPKEVNYLAQQERKDILHSASSSWFPL